MEGNRDGKSVVARLRERLSPEQFAQLQEASLQFQRGVVRGAVTRGLPSTTTIQIDVHEYYKLGVTLLEGDSYILHQLVARLPNATKRAEFAAHHLSIVRRCRAPGQQHLALPHPPKPSPAAPVPASAPWRAPAAATVAAAVDAALDTTPSSPMPTQRSAAPLDARSPSPVVVWLRRDLRLVDNHALHAAAACGRPLVLLYIWAPQELGPWPMGGATKYWTHHALAFFARTLRSRYNAELLHYDASATSSLEVLQCVVAATKARDVVWNRAYEPWTVLRDNAVDHALTSGTRVCRILVSTIICRTDMRVRVTTYAGSVLYEPWDAAPDSLDEACWRGGYGSVGFFLSGCQRYGNGPVLCFLCVVVSCCSFHFCV